MRKNAINVKPPSDVLTADERAILGKTLAGETMLEKYDKCLIPVGAWADWWSQDPPVSPNDEASIEEVYKANSIHFPKCDYQREIEQKALDLLRRAWSVGWNIRGDLGASIVAVAVQLASYYYESQATAHQANYGYLNTDKI